MGETSHQFKKRIWLQKYTQRAPKYSNVYFKGSLSEKYILKACYSQIFVLNGYYHQINILKLHINIFTKMGHIKICIIKGHKYMYNKGTLSQKL
jgi:hypothetical protein